jgi:hypothetical protein
MNNYGRTTFQQPPVRNMPGTPANAADWALERGEDPYKAALICLFSDPGVRETYRSTDPIWFSNLDEIELQTMSQYNKWVNENRGGRK